MEYGLHGSFKMITILFVVGIFMLVLACINYINLTTASSVIRTQEVAVKRFVGSSITLVRFQLILESIIVAVVSLIVALTVAQIFISTFNDITMANVNDGMEPSRCLDRFFIGVVILGIAAGIYPALYLTGIKPIRLMKAALEGATTFSSRSLLMTFQFALSVMLLFAPLVIFDN